MIRKFDSEAVNVIALPCADIGQTGLKAPTPPPHCPSHSIPPPSFSLSVQNISNPVPAISPFIPSYCRRRVMLCSVFVDRTKHNSEVEQNEAYNWTG